jgi:hypothetical protein
MSGGIPLLPYMPLWRGQENCTWVLSVQGSSYCRVCRDVDRGRYDSPTYSSCPLGGELQSVVVSIWVCVSEQMLCHGNEI